MTSLTSSTSLFEGYNSYEEYIAAYKTTAVDALVAVNFPRPVSRLVADYAMPPLNPIKDAFDDFQEIFDFGATPLPGLWRSINPLYPEPKNDGFRKDLDSVINIINGNTSVESLRHWGSFSLEIRGNDVLITNRNKFDPRIWEMFKKNFPFPKGKNELVLKSSNYTFRIKLESRSWVESSFYPFSIKLVRYRQIYISLKKIPEPTPAF